MNKHSDTFSFTGRIRSFRYAVAGIAEMLKGQHNAWVHLAATVAVVALALSFDVGRLEWGLLILAITVVWVAEGLNTALEFLCDVASPEFHPLVEKAKDVAAGAVLISALGAAAVGLIVFFPYLAGSL